MASRRRKSKKNAQASTPKNETTGQTGHTGPTAELTIELTEEPAGDTPESLTRALYLEQRRANHLQALSLATRVFGYGLDRTFLYVNLALITLISCSLYFLFPVFGPALMALVISHLLVPVVKKLSGSIYRTAKVLPDSIENLVARYVTMFATALLFLMVVLVTMTTFYRLLPEMVQSLKDNMPNYLENMQSHVEIFGVSVNLKSYVKSALDEAMHDGGHLFSEALTIAKSQLGNTLKFTEFTLLTALYSFVMILNWSKVQRKIRWVLNEFCTPDGSEEQVNRFTREIGGALRGYARGKMLVMLCMMTYYSCAYGLMSKFVHAEGIPMGYLLGMLTGFLCIMPIAGMALGIGLTIMYSTALLSTVSPTLYVFILIVGLVGFLLEGKILDPYFVGSQIKVHGVLVIFAIVAGASVGGLFGMFIATPVLAVLTVLIPWSVRGFQEFIKPESRARRQEDRLRFLQGRAAQLLRETSDEAQG